MKQTIGKGFTLIELLIVVAIIAILAAIAVPNFLEAQTRAKVSRAKADMRTVTTAIESYHVDNNKYPSFRIQGLYLANSQCVGESAFLGASLIGAQDPDNPGNIVCGVSSRLLWITTPISYLTSIPAEAFNIKGLAGGSIAADDPKFYDTYDFLAAKTFDIGGDLNRPFATAQGSALTSGAQWRLVSSGPDLVMAFGGRTFQEGLTGTGEANALGSDYDSSNGTISTGDIVRVGGGRGPVPNPAFSPYFDRVGEWAGSQN